MAQIDERVFRMVNFSPVGLKMVNYPVQYCGLCRGYLTEPCSNCLEKGDDKCTVTNQEESYYHTHCYTFMNADNKKSSNKKKAVANDTDTE